MMKTPLKTLAFATALLLAPLASHAASDEAARRPAAATVSAAADMTAGEVRKVDIENGKLTLKHGEIKSLDMPAMTMVFVVKDRAVLDKLKAGDKVVFKAVNDSGKYTVTEIAPAKP